MQKKSGSDFQGPANSLELKNKTFFCSVRRPRKKTNQLRGKARFWDAPPGPYHCADVTWSESQRHLPEATILSHVHASTVNICDQSQKPAETQQTSQLINATELGVLDLEDLT